MRKLFYLGFCLVLAMGVGCAITNYSLITDNDQVANGQGTGIVNTNGKAHIIEGSQIATLWPDGADEWLNFVDQKANGDRVLTNYNNFSAAYPIFHDDEYCNPDWNGCSMVTSQDPEVGDVDIFDYTYNINCKGIRSFYLLLSTSRYYGECGRVKMPLADRINLINMGRLGRNMGLEGLFYDLNRSNATITLNNNAGFVTTLPMNAQVQGFFSFAGRKATLDMTNPLLASMGRAYADFLANHATHQTTVTMTYNGISMNWNIAGANGLSNASNVLAAVNAHF